MADRPPARRRRRRVLTLVALLAVAAGTSTYLQGALSVLSSEVIAEFDMSRSQLGLVFTAFSMVGGFLSPVAGWLSDLSTRRVMAGLFGVSIAAILLTAAAPSYLVLLVAGFLGGLGLAAGNPATNKLITRYIPFRRQGIVIGIKQAGPPMGLLAAGVVLPPAALVLGWRWALALTALAPLAGLVVTQVLIPADRTVAPATDEGAGAADSPEGRVSNPATVRWMAATGLGIAFGVAGLIAFLPLYGQEVLDLSPAVAGSLAAVTGVAGVVGRIGWGAVAPRFRHATGPLVLLGVVSVAATGAVWLAAALRPLVWIGVVVAGASMLSWHAVAWLVVLDDVPASSIGRASGMVQLGNSMGFALGPPAVGFVVDRTGTYGPAWALVIAVFVAVTVATVIWRRSVEVPQVPRSQRAG